MLFADVRGYTQLTAGLRPEQVPELMNRFYETASGALLKHDALLGQIEGDNVMALFLPGFAGHEYKAHAVEAGCSLVRAVGTASELGLDIGVGIASGEEFVGNVGGGGYKDFTALGEVTNTAARLTANAASSEVLMDKSTFEAVTNAFPHAQRRELELKGMHAPVESYAIIMSANSEEVSG